MKILDMIKKENKFIIGPLLAIFLFSLGYCLNKKTNLKNDEQFSKINKKLDKKLTKEEFLKAMQEDKNSSPCSNYVSNKVGVEIVDLTELSECILANSKKLEELFFAATFLNKEDLVFKYTMMLANSGNTGYYVDLANCYKDGIGTTKDINKAIDWMKKSSEEDNQQASAVLGTWYVKGAYGVKNDFKESFKYTQKAASLGYANAMANLGYLYQEGKGVKPNLDSAFYYYYQSSLKNDPVGLFNLGVSYLQGEFIEKNDSMGLELIRKSASRNNPNAQSFLGNIYMKSFKMSNGDEISTDYDKSIDFLTKSTIVNRSDTIVYFFDKNESYYKLGLIYNSQKKDIKKAIENYSKCAKNGDERCQKQLDFSLKKVEKFPELLQ